MGLGNLLKNPADSISIVVPLGMVAGWWLLRCKRSDTSGGANQAKLTILFLMLGTTPIVMFYMFYFYQSVRFLLPPMAVLLAITGGLAGRRLRSWGSTVAIGLAFCVLIASILVRHFRIEEPPFARMTADDINRLTPHDALGMRTHHPAVDIWATEG